MKNLEEAAREQAAIIVRTEKDFKAGVEYAQRFIPVEEELPELGIEVLLYNKQWITTLRA